MWRNQTTERSIARNKAKDSREKFFSWECEDHGFGNHYACNDQCVKCEAERLKKAREKKAMPKKVAVKKESSNKVYKGWQV